MNQLQHETSPYLLQHAHNPVNWHAWKPEALEKARLEDKPILVSIGYSTCHWCHVMERESFEDQEVAEFMNDHFVCIKVDREERPDVDQIYMEACQIMTGGGGWPLNCFLMPDGRPFYTGTYFPPAPAHGRASWLQVLMHLSHAFQHRRPELEEQADRLTNIIRESGKTFIGNRLTVVSDENPFHPSLLKNIYHGLQKQFDLQHGGFGGAPKFPGTMVLNYLLNYHYCFDVADALRHVVLSLDKMAMGGIYDQLGGGFARYSTDAEWLAPHFEKMLYDNALLVSLYSEACKLTRKDLYRETIEETLEWVSREMTAPDGGFFSALDADSEGVEGKFYVWTKAEIETVLGKEAALFCEFYDVSEDGNWEEHNILRRLHSFEDFASKKGLALDFVKNRLASARQKLFEMRSRRIQPGLDDKILLDWNALMVSAFAKAYAALGREAYRQTAVSQLDFLLQKMAKPDGVSLLHTYKNGNAQYDAFLDDYAYLIEALLDVYEITFDTRRILQAERYLQFVLDNFLDESDKMFYFTSARQKDILLRRKDLFDSATPSGNSTMVRNLQRLGILTGKEVYLQLAEKILITLKNAIERYPSSFGRWADAAMSETVGIHEIAVVGNNWESLAKAVNSEFLPYKVLMASADENGDFPLLEGKKSLGDTLIYVCQNYACQKPVSSLEEFAVMMKLRQ